MKPMASSVQDTGQEVTIMYKAVTVKRGMWLIRADIEP